MTLRTGHGTGAGSPRIEVLPADELPVGLPAAVGVEAPTDRGQNGRFRTGNRIAAVGGWSRASQSALANRMGLSELPGSPEFSPYLKAAAGFRRAQCTALAKSVGGGWCGPGPSSVVATAAWQLAASRFLFEKASRTGDAALFAAASRLGDAHRQSLLAAHELCAREASARAKAPNAAPWWLQGEPEGEGVDVPALESLEATRAPQDAPADASHQGTAPTPIAPPSPSSQDSAPREGHTP